MPYEILVDESRLIKTVKNQLESQQCFVKPIYRCGRYRVLRTSITDASDSRLAGFLTRQYESEPAQEQGLVGFTRAFLEKHRAEGVDELLQCLPLRYTLYTPLVLFNYSRQRSFDRPEWKRFFQDGGEKLKKAYFGELLETLFPQDVTHVAINMPIVETDVMRRPFNISPLYGELISPQLQLNDQLWDHPETSDFANTVWCHTTQNGIQQFWAPLFTMFSRGNIKEKKRVLDTFPDIQGNDVVDLYAGIGYFTLSYLKRGARNVFCFELNPWSVEALRRGLEANKFDPNRCHIYNESNETCIRRIQEHSVDLRVRHINLGLLPSSEPGWPLALAIIALNKSLSTVTLHIHENVHIDALNDGTFVSNTLRKLKTLNGSYRYAKSHLEKIKTFAPDVWHICLDVDVFAPKLADPIQEPTISDPSH